MSTVPRYTGTRRTRVTVRCYPQMREELQALIATLSDDHGLLTSESELIQALVYPALQRNADEIAPLLRDWRAQTPRP